MIPGAAVSTAAPFVFAGLQAVPLRDEEAAGPSLTNWSAAGRIPDVYPVALFRLEVRAPPHLHVDEDIVLAKVGFRNIAVHDYARLDPQIVRGIAADHLGDLEEFANEVLRKPAG